MWDVRELPGNGDALLRWGISDKDKDVKNSRTTQDICKSVFLCGRSSLTRDVVHSRFCQQ